jgi:cytochrome b
VVKPWKETLDVMLFADQLLSNPRRCFRLDYLVLLLLFFHICWTCVGSALSRRICICPSRAHP